MKGLKHLGLFWQLCVERYRHLTPHERQAISEAIGESLDPAPSDRFSSAVKVVALVPTESGGVIGWKTPRGHRLPSTVLQRGEQPLDALHRLLQTVGPFGLDAAEPVPAGLPRLNMQGHLVMAFRVHGCVPAEDLAQAHRRHLVQGQPDVLVAIPLDARYDCAIEAALVPPAPEAVLKENSLELAS